MQALPHDALYALQEQAPEPDSDSSILSTGALHKWLPFLWRRHSHDAALPVPQAAHTRARSQPSAVQLPARPPVHGHILDSHGSAGSNHLMGSGFGGEADSWKLPPTPPRIGTVAHKRGLPQKSAIARGLGEAAEHPVRCTPPPLQAPMSTACAHQGSARDAEEEALLAELGLGGGGAAPVHIKSSHAGGSCVTDLRSKAARERMGALLKRTGFRGPDVLTGEAAKRVWGRIAADAELPPHLQQQLADWLAARRRGHAQSADDTLLGSEDELPSPSTFVPQREHPAAQAAAHCPHVAPLQPVAEGREGASVTNADTGSPVLQAAHSARHRPPHPVAEGADRPAQQPPPAPPGSRPRSDGAPTTVSSLPRAGSNAQSAGSNGRQGLPHAASDAANGNAAGTVPRTQELGDATPFTATTAHHRRNTSVPMVAPGEQWVDADAVDGKHAPQRCAAALPGCCGALPMLRVL